MGSYFGLEYLGLIWRMYQAQLLCFGGLAMLVSLIIGMPSFKRW